MARVRGGGGFAALLGVGVAAVSGWLLLDSGRATLVPLVALFLSAVGAGMGVREAIDARRLRKAGVDPELLTGALRKTIRELFGRSPGG